MASRQLAGKLWAVTFAAWAANMKRILFCGGRDYNDSAKVNEVMSWCLATYGIFFTIQGEARGADTECKVWARIRGYPCASVPAAWGVHGNSAGPLRNSWMLQLQPDLCIAFPGGAGTANMVAQCRAAGVPVIEVQP